MKRLFLYGLIFSAALDVSSQELQFSQPVIFGPEVNTEDEELAPILSPDGQTLYFSRAFHNKNTGGKYAGTDIWLSSKDTIGNWSPAVNAGKPWNNKRSNAVIGISADGSTVYLTNAYSNKSGISFSRLVMGTWTKPEFIAVPGINRDDLVGIYVHPVFDVMLISMKGEDSYGEEDLYISLKDSLGSWSQPRNLGSTINTSGYEISPFFSQDKKRLYFSSNGRQGFGDVDIYYTERLYDSWEAWSSPRILEQTVNGNGFDAYFSIYDSIAFLAKSESGLKSSIYQMNVVQIVTGNIVGKVLLNKMEVEQLLGANVSLEFIYSKSEIELDFASRERLFYLVSKIKSDKNIHLQIIHNGQPDDVLSMDRIKWITNEVKREGVEPSRMLAPVEKQWGDKKQFRIEILLYKKR